MEPIEAALAKPGRESLGTILVRTGIITQAQLDEALPLCDANQRNLLTILADKGFAPEDRLLKAVSQRHKVPYFTTFKGLIDPKVLELIPHRMARGLLVIPIKRSARGLMVGMANPVDIVTIDTLAKQTGLEILPVLTTRRNLFDSINLHYGNISVSEPEPEAGKEGAAAGGSEAGVSIKILPSGSDAALAMKYVDDASVIDLVDQLIGDAVAAGVSDIHMEPTPTAFRLRFRLDGLLQDKRVYSKELEPAMVARIKILAKLDITETRLPQDGHIAVDYGGRGIDLRVSTLPIVYGEKVVIRVLDQAKSRKTMADLGLPDSLAESFRNVVRRPNGMLLVTGPTGSGKTTTLYAALNEINTPEKNIVTLEDPVEYRLAGINQMETNVKIDLTFATGLRAILRQDPNVILVGEIRDLVTAEIAVQASITGHMVFSTLHTKDSVGTVARLLNIRTEPFLLASALSGVMAQRLVRTLCQRCKVETAANPDELSRLGVPFKPKGPIYGPKGCESCLHQGYKGRIGIYEWLLIDREMRTLILEGASNDKMREAARAAGMTTLQESGLEKVEMGLTSLDEVVRVTHEDVEVADPTKSG